MNGEALGIRYRLARDAFNLDVDFELPMRGVTGLFGASGSGKTTLLRLLAGLSRPDEGRFSLGGELLDDSGTTLHKAPAERGVGIVFQESRLFGHLGVEGNIRYGERRSPRPPVASFDELVGLLGLETLLTRKTAELSGGEAQRVAIARALMSGPRLVLMDEPLAALDQTRRNDVLPFLEQLHARLAVPMIYVSHNLDEILRLADTMVILDQGRVAACGPLNAVLAGPPVPGITADNAGVVLDGKATATDPEHAVTAVVTHGGPLWVGGRYEVDAPLRLIVRAGDVSVSLKPLEESSIQNSLPARIRAVDEVDEATVLLRLDVNGSPLLSRITRRALKSLRLEAGSPVYANVKSVAVRKARALPEP